MRGGWVVGQHDARLATRQRGQDQLVLKRGELAEQRHRHGRHALLIEPGAHPDQPQHDRVVVARPELRHGARPQCSPRLALGGGQPPPVAWAAWATRPRACDGGGRGAGCLRSADGGARSPRRSYRPRAVRKSAPTHRAAVPEVSWRRGVGAAPHIDSSPGPRASHGGFDGQLPGLACIAIRVSARRSARLAGEDDDDEEHEDDLADDPRVHAHPVTDLRQQCLGSSAQRQDEQGG